MSFSFIEACKRDGSLVLYHDYRRWNQNFSDLSGQGNDGVPVATAFWGGGGLVSTVVGAGVASIADSASLRPTSLSIVGLYNAVTPPTGGGSFPLFKAASIYLSANADRRIYFYDGAATRWSPVALSIGLNRSIGITLVSGAIGLAYADGLAIGAMSGISTVAYNANPIKVGYESPIGRKAPIQAVLIFNDILTATEMAQLHGELMALPGGGH